MGFDEINSWLATYYPELELRRAPGGAYSMFQRIKQWTRYDMPRGRYVTEDGAAIDALGIPEIGYSPLFDTRGHILGYWVCEEVMRRDPKLWYRENNYFHQAFLQSRAAETQREVDTSKKTKRNLETWAAVKRNDKLMNRIAKHMTSGRMDLAVNELSPEELLRNARREKPREIRSKDFWRSVARG